MDADKFHRFEGKVAENATELSVIEEITGADGKQLMKITCIPIDDPITGDISKVLVSMNRQNQR